MFRLSHTKATVLKVKPHALISRRASGSMGNSRQSLAARVSTGRAHSASIPMVG